MPMIDPLRISCVLIATSFFLPTARADTLSIGPGSAFTSVAQAAKAARSGDTIVIAEGTYAECAVWRADNLTIRGSGSGARFEGPVCNNKATFIISGRNVVVDNIGFANAQSTDGNGAGIREQGDELLVENSNFTNNQDGILAGAGGPESRITVRNSKFTHNGACLPGGCAHAIYVGHLALLRVENSHFIGTQSGIAIKSRALRTEIVGSTIEDGPEGTSSYLVDIPNGGTLLMSGNTLERGPNAENHTAVVSIGEEGRLQLSTGIDIRDNSLTNDGPPTVFVLNKTTTPASLSANTLKGVATAPLSGPGSVSQR
jgi:hypothetical protein